MTQKRKLAAILSADVAGYSRMMGEDETATVATLNAYRDVFAQLIVQHQGRVVDTAGDSVLAMFDSVVEAMQCAAEFQHALAEKNAPLPETRRMAFRIGINLGDVIEQGDGSIYGDGVNIAARLQALADPGGIYLSGTAYDQVRNKLPLTYVSLGKKALKNIAEPVEVFRVSAPGATQRKGWHRTLFARRGALALAAMIFVAGAVYAIWHAVHSPVTPETPQSKTALKLPEDPSIAVLPFTNFGGDTKDEYFIDGMTETLITDLSRLRNLFVIARNSAFTYKGKAVDVRQVGQELGVRYVLEGSMQKTGDQLRVNVQLVEAQTGRHVWAERYDRKIADLFEIQDDLIDKIVTELEVKLLSGETARTWRKTTRNRAAYDLSLRGEDHFYAYTREGFARAQALFQQALDLDPMFVIGMVWLGWTHYQQGDAGWSPDSGESYRKAEALARKAISLDPTSADAYVLLATVFVTLEKHSEAVAAADKGLTLAPNQADTLVNAGWVLAQNGRPEEAIILMERALRLDPVPQDYFYGGLGDSLQFANRVEESIPPYRRCVERIPDFIFCQLGITVAYVELGKLKEAAIHAKDAVRINPKITATDNTYVRGIGIPSERTRVVEAFRKAGLK